MPKSRTETRCVKMVLNRSVLNPWHSSSSSSPGFKMVLVAKSLRLCCCCVIMVQLFMVLAMEKD